MIRLRRPRPRLLLRIDVLLASFFLFALIRRRRLTGRDDEVLDIVVFVRVVVVVAVDDVLDRVEDNFRRLRRLLLFCGSLTDDDEDRMLWWLLLGLVRVFCLVGDAAGLSVWCALLFLRLALFGDKASGLLVGEWWALFVGVGVLDGEF